VQGSSIGYFSVYLSGGLFMGSKHRLLPWIHEILENLDFETALDGFSGSGAVSYLLKTMGKTVISNDFLNFPTVIAKGLCVNSKFTLSSEDVTALINNEVETDDFIFRTYKDIFYTHEDLKFLDRIYFSITTQLTDDKKFLALTALIRACIKKQPRGIFTVSGDLSNYNDGRRDLKLTIEEHFREQIIICNHLIFDNGSKHESYNSPIDKLKLKIVPDLVYLDPPYVPKSDDNCYVKRYHFLEGLSKYWQGEEIMYDTKVKKIKKKHTPFSYRSKAVDAFDKLFSKFKDSTIVLSYSSNGFPDLETLTGLMKQYKGDVRVERKEHRYHIGNHANSKRNQVEEYLIIGQ
jgi:adenine-specific DNA-methyltransferase